MYLGNNEMRERPNEGTTLFKSLEIGFRAPSVDCRGRPVVTLCLLHCPSDGEKKERKEMLGCL